MRTNGSCGRGLCALLAVLCLLVPRPAQSACNLIPGTIKTFHSTRGVTNRPFAAPGEALEVRLRPCDPQVPGLGATPAENLVTVVFRPTGGAAPNAVVLTASTCPAQAQLDACEGQLGGGQVVCVSGAQAGLHVFDRDEIRHLRFLFPDTDDLLGLPDDDVTLAGPARIAVSSPSEVLPCSLATQSCSAHSGLRACIDNYFANDGNCGTATALATFPGFTALPPPNDYQAACFRDDPPCTADAAEVRAAIDAAGNLLLPVQWGGILVRDGAVPVPRLLQSRLKSPLPFQLPDRVFIGSFTPEGGKLPPIFEPQQDPSGASGKFAQLRVFVCRFIVSLQKREIFSRIWSAVLIQAKGRGEVLWASRNA